MLYKFRYEEKLTQMRNRNGNIITHDIQSVSGGILNVLGGGSMDYSE
jgi:hypothetical protein